MNRSDGKKANGFLATFGRLKHSKSKKALAGEPNKWDSMTFPPDPDAYEVLAECGRGMSATVYYGLCKTNNEKVAIKKLDLDDVGHNWEEIVREAHTMANHHHSNLLPLLCSFTHKNQLWMVEPYVSHGSVLNIMKYRDSDGFPEATIAVIVQETLKGLDYLHNHGMIHRDVKAGNILVDQDGRVFLADFGVSAPLDKRGGSWGQSARHTFVGTPCWMAPEVMEQSQYGLAADIWSLGITILELAHGHAPFARYPPFKVVMMTVQNPPPSLDSEPSSKAFSRDMHDFVALCLQKDPERRPSTGQLLEHRFFRHVPRDRQYLRRHVLANLPDVVTRVQHMRTGVAGPPCDDLRAAESKSNEEYQKGLSGWNFDVAELKRQAGLEVMEPLLEEDEGPEAREAPPRASAGASPEGAMTAESLSSEAPSQGVRPPEAAAAAAPEQPPGTGAPSRGQPTPAGSPSSAYGGAAAGARDESAPLELPPAHAHAHVPPPPAGAAAVTHSMHCYAPEVADEHGLAQATIGPVVTEAARFARQLSHRTAADAASALQQHAGAGGGGPELLAVASSVAIAAVPRGAAPTEVNVARHIRALELQDAPPQRVGRFLCKPVDASETTSWQGRGSTMHEDAGGRAQLCAAMQDDGAHSECLAHSEAFAVCDLATLKAKSKKGRFTLTKSDAKSEGGGVEPSPRARATADVLPNASETMAHEPLPPRPASTHDVPYYAATSAPGNELHGSMSYDSGLPQEPQPAQAGLAAEAATALPGSVAGAQSPGPPPAATPVSAAAGKKPSRFKVVSEVGDRHSVESGRSSRAAVGASDGAAPGAAPGPGAASPAAAPPPPHFDALAIVSKKLQELMAASVAQQDALRMLMSAISECSRGKEAAVADLARHPLIAVHLLGSEQHSHALLEGHARLRGDLDESRRRARKDAERVKALQKERDLLKNQLAAVKEQLALARGDSGADGATLAAASWAAPASTGTLLGWPLSPSDGPAGTAAHALPPCASSEQLDTAAVAAAVAAPPFLPPPLDVSHSDDGATLTSSLGHGGPGSARVEGLGEVPPAAARAERMPPGPAGAGPSPLHLAATGNPEAQS